jgi:hypothetical protein
MNLITLDTGNRRQVKQFLDLPFHIYASIPQWVPPLEMDARAVLNRRRYPYFQHSDATFLLVLEGEHVVGRLAVLDNRRYNEFNREQTAFFYLFECEDNREAAAALFEAGAAWARARGLNKIIGPRGFTPFDGFGLLVKGFEHRPAFGLPYNPPYYPALVEAVGFEPHGDVVSGYLNARTVRLPERIHRLSELVQQRRGLSVTRFRTRAELRFVLPRLRDIYNSALTSAGGGLPLTEAEVKSLADQMLWFADPKLIKFVFKGEQMIGFLFAYPDISAALQRTCGRLFPFGWLDLLLELRRTKWINVNGAGIVAEHRGAGGTAVLFSELAKSVAEGGFEHADIVQIGLENANMQREMRDLGIDFYKTHRVYQKQL